MLTLTEQDIKEVYTMLQSRAVHPSGRFDRAGRWYAANSNLIAVRSPSRKYKYSEMAACRTLKYVKAVARYYNCSSQAELLAKI